MAYAGKFLFMLLGFSTKVFKNSFGKGETMLFSLHKRKEPKEVCQRAVGSLSARVRKGRKLCADALANSELSA